MANSFGRTWPREQSEVCESFVAFDDKRAVTGKGLVVLRTAECRLRCLDTQGFRDGENNGPYREELFQDNAAANVNGRMQVLFGGGDGWLRAYDAASGHEVWRFDGNPKDARWLPRPGVLSRSSIIASPVFADGRVFVAMGQDPLHGNGPSLIHAISPNGQGDVTASSRSLCTQAGEMIGAPICGAPLHM